MSSSGSARSRPRVSALLAARGTSVSYSIRSSISRMDVIREMLHERDRQECPASTPRVEDLHAEALHFFPLRTELQEREIETDALQLIEPLADLFGCSDQPRAQAAIRDRIVLQRNVLLELRAGE